MGATNRPQDLDSAILRRMPTRFHINQPSTGQREQILKLILENESIDRSVDLVDVAKETDGFSGSDLREMCRDAALLCVRDFIHTQSDSPSEVGIRPIHQSDLEKAIGKMKKSKMAGDQNQNQNPSTSQLVTAAPGGRERNCSSRGDARHSSVLGPRPLVPSHSLWKSQPSSRGRYAARTSRYSGASSARPGNRTGDSLTSSCSRGPRSQSYRTKSRLAAYGTMRPDRKLRPERRAASTTEEEHAVPDWTRGAGLPTVLRVVVVGGGRSLVPVEAQQGEEGEERLAVTHQDGGRLRGRVAGPDVNKVSIQMSASCLLPMSFLSASCLLPVSFL
ncbi:ATPase family AAA domain-containing protein 1-B [Liparis tanakae]|uniref:ATPase family AAA domain-containing protein 1-B n=1 Tax=Liparis tanakae TaxID=230148 RepID=A0A4Z2EKQ0_9TELE|nr:ATPase family AAA domain-containing protein 1-B [Liparis tanakae]